MYCPFLQRLQEVARYARGKAARLRLCRIGGKADKLTVTVAQVREILEKYYGYEGLSTGSSSNPRASAAVTGWSDE
jgi:hypothetical protein